MGKADRERKRFVGNIQGVVCNQFVGGYKRHGRLEEAQQGKVDMVVGVIWQADALALVYCMYSKTSDGCVSCLARDKGFLF